MSISAEYIDISTFIDQREGYRGGRPFIVGTGVTVDRISVLHRIDGLSTDEIREEMNLSPSQVMAALAFYFANKETIDRQVDEETVEFDKAAEEYRALHGSVFDRIKARVGK